MKFQPPKSVDKVNSNDDVQTSPELADTICLHFSHLLKGKILEPCQGDGNFVTAIQKYKTGNYPETQVFAGDIKTGQDFLSDHWDECQFDLISTNWPWSKIRKCMQKAYSISDNIICLQSVNHCFTRARINDMKSAGFYIKEILFLKYPKEWGSSGFALGAIHYSRGKGSTEMNFSYF